ncbi:hypothetical protein [[Phormidium] sp. LEGE 05292]|nr:hypothetical protein [Phormidium sp. LEGE 05292]
MRKIKSDRILIKWEMRLIAFEDCKQKSWICCHHPARNQFPAS